jgi:hypothetical protein
MSHRIRSRASIQTPIEAIFERVMRRKMTPEERVLFQLTAPIEQMFSDIFKREMTPEERQILLVEPAETESSKEIISKTLRPEPTFLSRLSTMTERFAWAPRRCRAR